MDDLHTLPIRLGSLLFSITDPHPGHAVEYTRWYERDHYFAGGTINPYVFSGQRWIATADLKALRHCAPGNPISTEPRKGSYLHLFFILADANERWRQRNMKVVQRLYEEGRMEGSKRETVYTINPSFEWAAERDKDGVPAELALEHRFPGLVLTVSTVDDGADAKAFDAWFRDKYAQTILSANSPVALCLCLEPRPLIFGELTGPLGLAEKDDGRQRLAHLWFLDVPAKDVWRQTFQAAPEVIRQSRLGRLEWSSPFKPAVPGTNRYIDEL